ncbi:MAG TPA: hypothetical protein VF532_04875, partial [Candidatus Angelobacter sp.]
QPDASQPQSCDANSKWTEFEIPQYAQVSLHADPSTSWFFDSATGYARSAKRKGWLTLRFAKANAPQIQEQNLPLEIQFEPASRSLFWSLLKVALWLLVGALLSLVLRVSVPNIKRKSKLKDQLNEAAKLISTISTEVDSNLRVLLRVERRALDELRLAVWPFGPGYADYAKRVEEGLPTLNRRIDAVLRLDEALIRKKTLTEHSAAPTRLEQVEEMLGAVSETLKQDQLSEEEWVLVKQRLENAQKLLRDPTQAEKEAFEGMLSRRWKAIANHFGRDTTGKLLVPATLQGMEGCFPEPSLLPVTTDADGAQWLDSVGVVRADLQLSALELVWEFQFLSPAGGAPSERWKTAKTELNQLLSTPAIDNLGQAKRLLQQLAEGVQEDDIVKALEAGRATLSMDPSIARPDQTIRFSVQFRQTQPNLNTAAAREQISCHWVFKDVSSFRRRGIRRWLAEGGEKDSSLEIPEEGWHVHHYFERGVHTSTITVRFFKSNGDLIELKQGQNFPVLEAHPTVRRRGKENWQRFGMELTQLSAALLVPLATLASTTINGGTSGHWWELVAIGFASDTIKNILVGKDDTQTTSPAAGK